MTIVSTNISELLSSSETELRYNYLVNKMANYFALETELNQLCVAYILEYFQKMNIDTAVSASITIDEILLKLKPTANYLKFINYILAILKQDDIITIVDNNIIFTHKTAYIQDAIYYYDNLCNQYSSHLPFFELLNYCVSFLPKILRGDISAVEILFPKGTSEFLNQGLESRVVQYEAFESYKKFVINCLKLLSTEKSLNILEVGGGSGMLTWDLLKSLKHNISSYTFTDISRAFLIQAKSKAKELGYTFFHCDQLDISQDPCEQGFSSKYFDVILAVNVVHAIPDIDKTLTYLKNLLNPSGYLILSETFHLPRWSHFIWGLTEGWWLFEDKWRDKIPLVNSATWRMALNSCGFEKTYIFSSDKEIQEATHFGAIIAKIMA